MGFCRYNSKSATAAVWRGWLIALTGMVITVLIHPTSTIAYQQDGVLGEDTLVDDSSVFLPAPREMLRPLIRARKALEKGETAQAVEFLGGILSDANPEDYLIKTPGRHGSVTSLRGQALDLLGSVPRSDLQTYRLRYSILARQQLEAAVAESDFLKMGQVMRRFFYTDAGFDAAMLLGHHHLDQGHPVAAAFCYQRIVNNAEARNIHDPEASVLLATCWMLAGNQPTALEVLTKLKSRQGRRFIEFAGAEIPLFDGQEDAIEWLKKLVGDSPLSANRLVNQWVMFRGNPQRNANSGTGLPLLNPLWVVPAQNNPDDETLVTEYEDQLLLDGASTIPSVQPIAVGNTVVMRTFDRLVGIDFDTGKRIWMFPTWDEKTFFERDDKSERPKPSRLNKSPLAQRMWQDHLFGQTSSDGRHIFIVPQPGFAGGQKAKLQLNDGRTVDDPRSFRSCNELIAVEIGRQGALKWEVGGKTGLDEPKLANSFFLGPPLPLDGSLMVVCEQDSEIRLVALDPESGRLQWSQQLASTDIGGKVATNQYRRLAGATPSYSDGLVICPTGVGAVVAVEFATRSLLWGYQYGSGKNHRVSRIMPMQNSNANLVDGAWRDSTITIAGGCVIFTPVDRQELICLDLLTGQPKWKNEALPTPSIPRKDSLFVGCVVDQHIVLIGRSTVRSVNLQTGKLNWELNSDSMGRPSGRGYSNRQHYYLPMTSSKLLQIDIQTGDIDKVVRTNGNLGNLICYRDKVISHSAIKVAAFPRDDASRTTIALAESSGDLTNAQLVIRSQLEMQDGRIAEAAKTISRAFEKHQTIETEDLLVNVVLRLIESGDMSASDYSKRYESLLTKRNAHQFIVATVDGLLRRGESKTAIEILLEQIHPDQLMHNRDVMVRAKPNIDSRDPTLEYGWEQWLRNRVSQIAKTDSTTNKTISRFVTTLSIEDESIAFDVYRTIGLSLVPADKRNELAKKLIESKQILKAEFVMNPVTDMQPGFARRAPPQFDDGGLSKWNRGQVFSQKSSTFFDTNSTQYTDYFPRNRLLLKNSRGRRDLAQYQFRFFPQTGEVEILDRFGRLYSRFSVRKSKEYGHHLYNAYFEGAVEFKGDLGIISIGTEVFAIDWSRIGVANASPLLWVKDIRDPNLNSSSSVMQVTNSWGYRFLRAREYYNVHPVRVASPSFFGCWYINQTRLFCADPLSGKILWQRPNIYAGSRVLSDGKTTVVWHEKRRFVRLFDAQTGEQLDQYQIPPVMGSPWIVRGTSTLFSRVIPINDRANSESKRPAENDYYTETEEKKKDSNDAAYRRVMVMFDFATRQPVWEKTFSKNARACVLRNDRIFVLESSGELQTILADSGKIELTTTIDLPDHELKRVQSIEMEELEGCYFLKVHAAKSFSKRYTSSNQFYVNRISSYRTLWNGFVMAIDKTSGASLWKSPARLHLFQYMVNQPYSAPAVFFCRRIDKTVAGRSRRYWLQLIAIDIRDGRWIGNDLTIYDSSSDYRITSDPANQTVTCFTKNHRLDYRFTADSAPPAPVARIDERTAFYFRDEFKPTGDKKLIGREQERRELVQRLIKFQDEDLKKKRAAMKKQMEKQSSSPLDSSERRPLSHKIKPIKS